MSFIGAGSSVTSNTQIYPFSRTESYSNLPTSLAKFIIAATLVTSASTLPVVPFSVESAVSTGNLSIHSSRRRKYSWEAITDFATELQDRSISLSDKDSKLWRQIIVSQLQPGFPDF